MSPMMVGIAEPPGFARMRSAIAAEPSIPSTAMLRLRERNRHPAGADGQFQRARAVRDETGQEVDGRSRVEVGALVVLMRVTVVKNAGSLSPLMAETQAASVHGGRHPFELHGGYPSITRPPVKINQGPA